MNQTTYAYIAGMIDADGTIGIRRFRIPSGEQHYRPMVEVTNMSRDVIDLLHRTFQGTRYYEKRPKHVVKSGGIWVWRAVGTACIPVLEAVTHHLIIKREQAEIALDLARRTTKRGGRWTPTFRAVEQEARHELYLRAKRLNLPYHLREATAVHAENDDSTTPDLVDKS